MATITQAEEQSSKYKQSIIGDISTTGNIDGSTFTGYGGLLTFDGVTIEERSSNPGDPPEGMCVIWLSDGTGAGGDGDLMVKITAGGSTKTGTLIDFSGI